MEGENTALERESRSPKRGMAPRKNKGKHDTTMESKQRSKETYGRNLTPSEVEAEDGRWGSVDAGTSKNPSRDGELSALETSMAWSPGKKTGLKRNLEALEAEEESEARREEDEGVIEGRLRNSSEAEKEKCGRGAESEGIATLEEASGGGKKSFRAGAGKSGATAPDTSGEAGSENGAEAPVDAEPGIKEQAPIVHRHKDPSRVGKTTQLNSGTEGGYPRTRGGREYLSSPRRSISPRGKNANSGEKYGRGGKVQRLSHYNEEGPENEMVPEESRPIGTIVPYLGNSTHLEVIPETQACYLNGNEKLFKEILASIGLDSPSASHELGGHSQRGSPRILQGYTPIRNSAESLIALGRHMFTPRQGKSWEARNKCPLGS